MYVLSKQIGKSELWEISSPQITTPNKHPFRPPPPSPSLSNSLNNYLGKKRKNGKWSVVSDEIILQILPKYNQFTQIEPIFPNTTNLPKWINFAQIQHTAIQIEIQK